MFLDGSVLSIAALYSVQLATICPERCIIVLLKGKKVHGNNLVSSHLCFWKLHPAFSLLLKSKGWPTTVEIKLWWPLKCMDCSVSNNESLKNTHQQEGRKPVWVYKLWFSLKENRQWLDSYWLSFPLYFVHRLILHVACPIMLQQMTWGTGEQLDFSTLNLCYISVLFLCL